VLFTTELIQDPERVVAFRVPMTCNPEEYTSNRLTPVVVIPTTPAELLYIPVVKSPVQLKLGVDTESPAAPDSCVPTVPSAISPVMVPPLFGKALLAVLLAKFAKS